MAVDSERDRYHVNRVNPTQLSANWAAQAYRPDVIKALADVKKLGKCSTLKAITGGAISQGRTPQYADSGDGIPCLKTRHVIGIEITRNDPDWVTFDFAAKYPNLVILPNDIVVNRSGAGSIGRSGIYLHEDKPFTNEHLIRVRVVSCYDAAFVCTFLNTWWGERALERGITGATGQLNLALEYMQDVVVPTPHIDGQTYIGNKVRAAETLRYQAERAEREFVTALDTNVPAVITRTKCSRSQPLGTDLNAGKFVPDRLEVRRVLSATGGRRLGAFCSVYAQNIDSYPSSRLFLGLDGISSTSIDLTLQTAAEADICGVARQLVEGPVISKLRPYLNKTAFIGPDFAGAIGSTELLNVVPDGVHPGYVYGILKLGTTVRQLDPVATGATHPRITADDVLDVIVPWHKDRETLGQMLADAQPKYVMARRLTIAARLLVEALIKKKVTEADLVLSHKDQVKDRELLSRLTAKGIDVPDEPPLFPDLDILFDLLAEKDNQEVA